jgi:hypothetical protein
MARAARLRSRSNRHASTAAARLRARAIACACSARPTTVRRRDCSAIARDAALARRAVLRSKSMVDYILPACAARAQQVKVHGRPSNHARHR